jgi:hypothetical protein
MNSFCHFSIQAKRYVKPDLTRDNFKKGSKLKERDPKSEIFEAQGLTLAIYRFHYELIPQLLNFRGNKI